MSFLFEPARFINDEAVRLMEPVALGGYMALFCHLWEQPEPGVVPADDRLLASMARMAPETWTLARSQIARAFDTTSRAGFWIQKGMAETYKAQNRFLDRQRNYGKLGGLSKASQRQPLGSLKEASSPQGSVLGSVTENLEPERPRARKPRAPISPVLTISHEQREAAAKQYGLDPAVVESLAAQVEALAASGKYVSAPGALHTFCRNELRFAKERNGSNGHLTASKPRKVGGRWLEEGEWQCTRCKAVVWGSRATDEDVCRSCLGEMRRTQ